MVYILRRMGVHDYRTIVLGDDSVVATRCQPDPERLTKLLAELGLTAKVKVNSDPDFVEFCSGRFWHTDQGRVWGPKPGRLLAKIGYAVARQDKPLEWFKGVLLGVKADTAHVPVVNVYVKHCLELLQSTHAKARVEPHKIHVERQHKAVGRTYEQFYKIYNLNPSDLDTLRDQIKRISSVPHLLDHPLFEELVFVDT
jgi:hypothetical protein